MSSKKKILKEELTNKDLENIRLLIRYEVAQIILIYIENVKFGEHNGKITYRHYSFYYD